MAGYAMDAEQVAQAALVNAEVAMRSLARAGALEDERWGLKRLDGDAYRTEIDALHNSGALWMQARALCRELGRDWDSVADGARRYADQVMRGNVEVV